MLILSRKKGEEVLVPEYGIVFTIAQSWRDKVHIGVSAPADVQVKAVESAGYKARPDCGEQR